MMTESTGGGRFEIKKYPNRRFYDVTRSRHVTLTDLFELVRTGNQIMVTDSATGNDITNVVLAQIILEHDPPKLDLFPASLLHQAIQANEQMVRKFIDQYFAGAMDAFVQSRKQFDDYLRRVGFSPLTPMAPFDWVRMLFPNGSGAAGTSVPDGFGFSNPAGSQTDGDRSERATAPGGGQGSGGPSGDDRAFVEAGGGQGGEGDSIDALRRQMAGLRAELESLRADARPTRGRPAKNKKKKAGRRK